MYQTKYWLNQGSDQFNLQICQNLRKNSNKYWGQKKWQKVMCASVTKSGFEINLSIPKYLIELQFSNQNHTT